MKKTLLSLLFLIVLIPASDAQEWLNSLPADKQNNFYEIQKSFENYWQSMPKERGTGYNVYKRWEWFWEQRVDSDGNFPPANQNYMEWLSYSKNYSQRRNIDIANWKPMGPTTTPSGYNGLGRLNCLAFHPTDSNTFWVGSPSGGVWKTTDFGKTWKTSTDRNPVLGVSSILVHPSNPDTLYIGTGDGDRGSLWGMNNGGQGDNKSVGVLASYDGGETWNTTGLSWQQSESFLIRKMVMHPDFPHIILCASSNGVYKTENSGTTWTRVSTGYYIDIEYMPGNPNVVYASTFSTSGNARVVRSLDGGNTFGGVYTIANGSRIEMAVSPAQPELLQMLVAHRTGGRLEGIYESTDSGTTFVKIFSAPNILHNSINGSGTTGQGWYDLTYEISPTDPNLTYAGGVNTWRSTNKGRNFSIVNYWTGNGANVPVVHADKHFFTHHPMNPNLFFDCNDGGIYFTRNRGASWTDISNGLDITQMYRIAIHPSDTGVVLIGTQDNGTRIRRNEAWREATGGDGMDCAIDPINPNYMYSTYAYGVIYRSNNAFTGGFGTSTISNNIPNRPQGAWVTPIAIDPKNSGTIYAGYFQVYKSTDYGASWTSISNNLANSVLLRNLTVAKNNTNILYAGDYTGIYRTWNSGGTWEKIVSAIAPITKIETDPNNDSIIYFTHAAYVDGYKVQKFNGCDSAANKRLSNISKNLPNISANAIVYQTGSNEGLYVGTDLGVFYTNNTLTEWIPFMENLPNVVVTDLEINYNANILYAGTYGRGVWKSNLAEEPKALPVLLSFTPEHKSTNISLDSTLEITFTENVALGNGTMKIFQNNTLFDELETDTNLIEISNNRVKIKPSKLFGYKKEISVSIPYGFFTAENGIPISGINNEDWKFTTIDAPNQDNLDLLFSFYPNPASTQVSVLCESCLEKYKVKLIHSNGKILQEIESTQAKTELQLLSFSPGVYILQIEYNGKNAYHKIILHKGI
jgi:photosystem II stability/assembly factor-like uncharacterized protein